MRDYGIDGVFLQRFTSAFSTPERKAVSDHVMDNVQASAKKYGRTWGVMYDLHKCKRQIAPTWRLAVQRTRSYSRLGTRHWLGMASAHGSRSATLAGSPRSRFGSFSKRCSRYAYGFRPFSLAVSTRL